MRGGRREGAGRIKGAPNKKTEKKIKAVQASGLMPLDYMLSVLRDESQPIAQRFMAAKEAAPYVHAKLAAKVPGDKDDAGPHLIDPDADIP